MGGDSFKVHLKYYCLKDSAIKVPKELVYMYKLDSFVTHNFVTRVRIERNGVSILEKTIHKEEFDKFLYPEWKQYSVLRDPSLELKNNLIEISNSISIPLTDLGVLTSILVDRDGKVIYKLE
jgi:predicted nucleotidyltransferase